MKVLTFANFITITRLFFNFLFIDYIQKFVETKNFQYWIFAFLSYFTALLTDYLDGLWARYFKQISVFGSYLDPICDKILLFSSLWIAFNYFKLPLWFLLIYIFREITLTFYIVLLYKRNHTQLKPNFFGKIQMVLIPVIVFLYGFLELFFENYPFILFYLNIFTFLVSAMLIIGLLDYKKTFWKILFPKN